MELGSWAWGLVLVGTRAPGCGQGPGLLLLLLALHPNKEGEDGLQCWRLLRWLCSGQLMEGCGSPSGEKGWL